MQANKADFQGDVVWQSTDRSGRPKLIQRVPNSFSMRMSRPVSLPQKQTAPKLIETTLFVPPTGGQTQFNGRLASSAMGMQYPLPTANYHSMAPHEYHMVVLSRDPRRYAFLNSKDSIVPPDGGEERGGRSRYYFVLMPPANKPVPLSSQVLTWTSIAYLIWDDMSAANLNEGQQRALLDWLHWGGQLIVSGPETLDTLRGTFLAPYLPAESGGTTTLSTADLANFSSQWTMDLPRGPGRQLQAINPWSAVKLKLRGNVPGVQVLATTLGDAPLVVEGRVGRGRVVVTSFHLTERELSNWPSFDHFFNACLLRRPGREYEKVDDAHLLVSWKNDKQRRLDPTLVTGLRLFGRDGGYKFALPTEDAEQSQLRFLARHRNPQSATTTNDQDELTPLGLGSWNDSAPVANAARSAIRNAAGIEIPSGDFVIWVLAAYLVVLVPLNWCLFRLIGRIEWAWIAAPLIAIAGTALVVRLAQLDIGFVRSVTDVGVLETQPSYPRGHLTRFSALYTSLSTGYDFEFDETTGLIQPFSTGQGSPLMGETPLELEYRRDDQARLSGFHVLSNRTDLMRSEQVIELGGPIQSAPRVPGDGDDGQQPAAIHNGSKFELRHAFAVRSGSPPDTWEVAWLGNVGAGADATAPFETLSQSALLTHWDEKASVRIGDTEKALSLRLILKEALSKNEFRPGDLKLFATIESPMSGLTVKPRSTQQRHLTLVVANLVYAPRKAPQHDANSRLHFTIDPPKVPLEGEEQPAEGLTP